jgi:hypothetical protein
LRLCNWSIDTIISFIAADKDARQIRQPTLEMRRRGNQRSIADPFMRGRYHCEVVTRFKRPIIAALTAFRYEERARSIGVVKGSSTATRQLP